MSKRAQVICGVIAAVLAALALLLFYASPGLTLVGSDEDLKISCDSIADAGEGKGLSEDYSSRSDTYEVTEGQQPKAPATSGDPWAISDRLDSQCDRRRTVYLAYIIALLAPASALAAISLFPRRRPEEADDAED